MQPIQLFDPASSTYTYVLVDEATRDAVIIDPVDEQLARDLALLREHGLRLVWAVETHAHADHITSAGLIAEHAGARTAAPEGCGIGTAAVQLGHGDVLRFGGEELKALHTPGHTAGSMSYLWRGHVFTGDTLLINGCGRTDFQSGSAAALYRSITEVLFALPDATMVWPGHDYHGRSHSTIGAEKAGNARVAGKTLAEFKAIMNELHLPKPKRLDEAVPANLSSGLRHDAGAPRTVPRRRRITAQARGGLRRRRDPAAGLRLVAKGRGRAAGRPHRRRTGVGRLRPRRGAARLEAVAGHGAERVVRRRPEGCRAARQEGGAAVPQRRPFRRGGQSARPNSASRPTTSWKASKAIPTKMRIAGRAAAGACAGCPGGSADRHPDFFN